MKRLFENVQKECSFSLENTCRYFWVIDATQTLGNAKIIIHLAKNSIYGSLEMRHF